MSKDQIYNAIILKKTPFNEADEIVTFYTKEQGKVRGLAKSVKLQKSKLQHSLQGLFLVRVGFAEKRKSSSQSSLKQITHCETVDTFAKTRQSFLAAKTGLYAAEVVFRSTPDEQPNLEIFNLLHNLLKFLNQTEVSEAQLVVALTKFKLLLLTYLGHEILIPEKQNGVLFFSNTFGGFGYDLVFQDRIKVSGEILEIPKLLLSSSVISIDAKSEIEVFSKMLDTFLEYQIERRIFAKTL